MGTVISLNEHRPHLSGQAICIQCRHQWVAVVPLGAYDLECPECHTFKGAWLGITVPNPGDGVWICNCDNDLFFIVEGIPKCAKCGVFHPDSVE